MVNTVPVIVDRWFKNKDVAEIATLCYNRQSLHNYQQLRTAVTTPLIEQTWFYLMMYDSGLYEVMESFNVPREEIETIKILINYDNNPSYRNFIRCCKVLFRPFEFIITKDFGRVTVSVVEASEFGELFLVAGQEPETFLVAGEEPEEWLEFAPFEVKYTTESNYILQHYIPVGVELIIDYISSSQFLELAKKYKKKVKYANKN